jgi:hypothetical protein
MVRTGIDDNPGPTCRVTAIGSVESDVETHKPGYVCRIDATWNYRVNHNHLKLIDAICPVIVGKLPLTMQPFK